jgi:hypothetical protein
MEYHPTFALAEPANFTVLGQEDKILSACRQAQRRECGSTGVHLASIAQDKFTPI